VLWHIACCVRPRTLKCIIAKNGDQVELMDVPYNHARGFERMGLESPPAPAPYAWWCVLSCVTLIVRQVAAYPFDNDPRPLSASAAEEVYGTSFVMSDNNTGVKPDYSVVLAGVPATAGINTAVFKAAAERRFGAAIMGTSFAATFPSPARASAFSRRASTTARSSCRRWRLTRCSRTSKRCCRYMTCSNG
jgi:hypothetical protein